MRNVNKTVDFSSGHVYISGIRPLRVSRAPRYPEPAEILGLDFFEERE